MAKWDTLFLDRDGVINKKLEGRYVRNWHEFEFMPHALEAIVGLTSIFKRILVITNQQGIAKGIMTQKDLFLLHQKLSVEIQNAGGKIEKWYHCPHLAEEKCGCRKPEIGMILQAQNDFPTINMQHSYLVGDSATDIEAGQKAGLHTIQVDDQFTLYQWFRKIIS